MKVVFDIFMHVQNLVQGLISLNPTSSGGFNGLSTFIFVLGKLGTDGGLHDLLVD
jgi:lantibiotic modifying enzyme